jgi:hypothetical protein
VTGRRWLHALALLGLVGCTSAGQRAAPVAVPRFEPDASFPQLPNGWTLGNVSDVAVDRNNNVWIIHRPRTVRAGSVAAPPVLEFNAAGKFLQAWGGEGAGYDWPDAEHNICVDHKGNVWISGSSPSGQSKTSRSDDMLIKFTGNGKFLLQIGGRSVSQGSKDTHSVNKPGDVFVSARTNEVYVADGYGNRRVVVFDAETGAFRRMWGAFGLAPEDDKDSGGRGPSGGPLAAATGSGGPPTAAVTANPTPPTVSGAVALPAPPASTAVSDTDGPGPPRFASPVHGIVVSNDNIVYVADRRNQRVQLFTTGGKYIDQMFVARGGAAVDTVTALALSPDRDQKFLYLADFGNSQVLVADRRKLQILDRFGKRGAAPGDFQGLHQMAVDSNGTLYTAEVAPGARVQKLTATTTAAQAH